MDNESLDLVQRVWRHSGIRGYVWIPHISKIGVKGQERFREGPPLKRTDPQLPELRDSVDWYWTPGVSSADSRKAKKYPGQRVLWVDCDESYDMKLLESLRPSYMWETSPGHRQAVWLMREEIPASEYHKDGLMGMLTQTLGADPSGVDIGQLLRFPGTWHHKREPFQGRILASSGAVFTRGQMLTRVARGLGFSPQLASELGADDPYGDRSKLLWKFARSAAELGIAQDLMFKLIKGCGWNKWKDDPEKLKADIARAYDQQPAEKPVEDTEQQQAIEQLTHVDEDEEELGPWPMATVGEFGTVLRKPISWILPDIIPAGGVGLLIAAPKVGKTRIAIEMALGLATGRKPLGIPAQQKAVGFFSLEDGEYLFSERLVDGMQNGRSQFHWDGHITRLGKELVWVPPTPMPLLTHFSSIDLKEGATKQRLLNTIIKHELDLVIIDTLSMAIGDTNVSDSKEMNKILPAVREIARATGCAIMFIHHTRKRVFEKGETIQESILGSTALHAWCDFIMSLSRLPEPDQEILRLNVQSKRGGGSHYLNDDLKIIPKPPAEEVSS